MHVAGLLQEGSFDRQPVVLNEAVAAYDLKIGMNMHQLSARLVESKRVEDTWMPDAGARLRELEAIFEERCVEEFGVTFVDQEIDVLCSRKRLIEPDIAFRVTL